MVPHVEPDLNAKGHHVEIAVIWTAIKEEPEIPYRSWIDVNLCVAEGASRGASSLALQCHKEVCNA